MSHIIAGFLFLYIACFIAAGGGIGGGGVNTPILLVVLRFTYSESVLLSLATVAGNYMAQFLLNHNLRHPAAPSRPLIYWDAVLILLPAQLGGSNIGAILLRVLPETPILIMALLVTLFAFVGTFGKLSFYIKKENDAKEKLDRESGGITHESALTLNLILNDGLVDSASAIPLAGYEDGASSGGTKENCSSNIRMEVPFFIIGALAAVWSVYLCFFLVMKNYLQTCTTAYYVTLSLVYIPLAGTIGWALQHVSETQRSSRHSLLVGDISFKEVGAAPPMLAFAIGILCSLLGIGGGELMGPLLLHLKVLPQVSSATTSIMSLMNTSLSILHYVIAGGFPYNYASICFAIGFAGGLSGRFFALFVTKVYKRASVTILLLLAILAASLALIIYDLGSTEQDFRFKSLC